MFHARGSEFIGISDAERQNNTQSNSGEKTQDTEGPQRVRDNAVAAPNNVATQSPKSITRPYRSENLPYASATAEKPLKPLETRNPAWLGCRPQGFIT